MSRILKGEAREGSTKVYTGSNSHSLVIDSVAEDEEMGRQCFAGGIILIPVYLEGIHDKLHVVHIQVGTRVLGWHSLVVGWC